MFQYCQHLHKHTVYLEPVRQSFKSFIDGVADDSIILLVCFVVCPVQISGWSTFSICIVGKYCDVLAVLLQMLRDIFDALPTFGW